MLRWPVSSEVRRALPGETEVLGGLYFLPTSLNDLPPPPVWAASAVIGHEWIPRRPVKPKVCAKFASPYWDKPKWKQSGRKATK